MNHSVRELDFVWTDSYEFWQIVCLSYENLTSGDSFSLILWNGLTDFLKKDQVQKNNLFVWEMEIG